MNKIQFGETVEINSNHDYQTNCALCAKPLGAKFSEILVDADNRLITRAEYNAAWERDAFSGEYVQTLPIGSTCISKVAA